LVPNKVLQVRTVTVLWATWISTSNTDIATK